MPLFRFANISGPKKIDKKESEKKNLEAEKDAELESILEKHPSAFSIEEIVGAELPNGSDEEKSSLKEDLLDFIGKKTEKDKEEYEEKDSSKEEHEEILAIRKKLEEKEFDELKNILTEDYIQKCKEEYYSYHKEEKGYHYFVGIACNKLALAYLKNLKIYINNTDNKKLEETKNKFKEFYYEKNKKKYNPPSNIRNFYEVEKPDDDIKE
jgi:hypothetical protein